LVGCLTAGVALSAFAYEWDIAHNLTRARDAAFSTLVIAELLRAFGARSDTHTVWQMGLVANMPLFVIVVASFALQLAMHYLPAMQRLFGTSPVSLSQCIVWVALGAIPLGVIEFWKVLRRSRVVS